MAQHASGRARTPASRPAGRRAPLWRFFGLLGLLLVGLVVWLVVDLHGQESLHDDLAERGAVVTARVSTVELTRYESGPKGANGRTVVVTDPDDADGVDVRVRFTADGRSVTAAVGFRFSVHRRDHLQPFRDARAGRLRVRYLPGDPSKVRPEAEFSDPGDNRYGFDW